MCVETKAELFVPREHWEEGERRAEQRKKTPDENLKREKGGKTFSLLQQGMKTANIA